MKDYFGNQVEVGDIILVSNLSVLEEHVVLSFNPDKTAMSASCQRYRGVRGWRRKAICWEVNRKKPITSHNSKKRIWVIPNRIIRIGKYDGNLKEFKTIKQLENEYKLSSSGTT